MAKMTRVAKAQKDQGRCDYSGCTHPERVIRAGEPYIWIKPRSHRAERGRKLVRHADHPAWQVWEYSSSLSSRLAQIAHEYGDASSCETPDDVTALLEDAATAVEELAGEKRESAESIESGFQHETYQSQELGETADSLESWAEEIRGADVPELPEPEEEDCEECEGSGNGEDSGTCEECSGSGTITPDEPTEEQMDAWREEVQQLLDDTLGNSPV